VLPGLPTIVCLGVAWTPTIDCLGAAWKVDCLGAAWTPNYWLHRCCLNSHYWLPRCCLSSHYWLTMVLPEFPLLTAYGAAWTPNIVCLGAAWTPNIVCLGAAWTPHYCLPRCCLNCNAQCLADEAEYAKHDSACTSAGGVCKDNTNYCAGSYQVVNIFSSEAEFMNVQICSQSSQTWDFCIDFLNYIEGVWFSIRFSSFLLYSLQQLNCKYCKRLREFEEIEISRQSCWGDFEKQGGKFFKTFVWISSLN
jgi:hypothetical protein